MSNAPSSEPSNARNELPEFMNSLIEGLRKRLATTTGGNKDQGQTLANSDKVPDQAFNTLYSSSIDQMYKSREAFMSTAQAAQNTMVLFYSAAGATAFLWLRGDKPLGTAAQIFLFVTMVVCLAIPPFLSHRFRDKLLAGYNLYCAATIHAFLVVKSMGVPLTHTWLESVLELCELKGYFFDRRKADLDRPSADVVNSGTKLMGCHFAAAKDEEFHWLRRLLGTLPLMRRVLGPTHIFWFYTIDRDPRNARTLNELIAIWRYRGANLFQHYYLICCRLPRFVSPIAIGFILLLAFWEHRTGTGIGAQSQVPKGEVQEPRNDANKAVTDLDGLQTDMNKLRTELDKLRTDANTLRTDVSTLRADVSTLRTDVNTLRTDVLNLNPKIHVKVATPPKGAIESGTMDTRP
jgi:outer membrane murein-binding lipoprotein Lpp